MTILQITVLAVIQGLTEFLPVSSSAHLILPSQLLGWEDQGIGFDVAVHVGTLLAVILYYLSDLIKIASYTCESVVTRKMTPLARIGWCIILATIPAGVCGILFEHYISTALRSIEVIACTTIGFGLLLGVASYFNRHKIWRNIDKIAGQRSDSLRSLSIPQALLIGCAQALSLVPGTSRSGITLTAGLFLGLKAEAAARFSFLLSIPIIMASGLLECLKLYKHPELSGASWSDMLIGGGLSFVIALAVIHWFMRYISKSGMTVFVLYRVFLGIALLLLF